VTGTGEGWEIDDYDDLDDDGDWRDYDDDGYEPDPEDAEIARADAEYWEHCDERHGGGHCTCRPPLRDRLRGAWQRARRLLRRRPRYADEPPF